jgi:hypothetical protein
MTPRPFKFGFRSSASIWVAGLTILSACPRNQGPEPPTPSAAEAQARAHVEVNADRLFEVVATLASDGLGGRYSLHREDIGRAADYIAAGFEAAGVPPVGPGYRHDFTMVTGAELTSDPVLELVRGNKSTRFTPDEFVPLTAGGSGRAEGDIVFVGYAAQASAEGAGTAYDDLAGVDLRGKIALVLAEAPGRPNPRELYGALRTIKRRFDSAAASLREADDAEALAKLHATHSDELAALVRPFIGDRALPPRALERPADVTAFDLDIAPYSGAVFTPDVAAETPRFEYRAGRLSEKLPRLVEAGAVGVILVKAPHSFVDDAEREADALPSLDESRTTDRVSVPVVRMRWQTAERAFRIDGKKLSAVQRQIDRGLRPRSAPVDKARARMEVAIEPIEVAVPNVLAKIEGSSRPDEIVVIGAHYDHIGTDEEGGGTAARPRTSPVGTPSATAPTTTPAAPPSSWRSPECWAPRAIDPSGPWSSPCSRPRSSACTDRGPSPTPPRRSPHSHEDPWWP